MSAKKDATLTRLLEFIFLEVFMAYGTYANNYNYANPYGYLSNNYYGGTYQPNWTQPPQQQQMVQQQQPAQNGYNIPIEGVIFLTSDEAKAYIVPPNKRVMIMDRDKSVFYIKSADALGQSTTSPYKFEPLSEEQPKMEIETPNVDAVEYVKKEDIKEFVTTEDLQHLKNDFAKSIEDLKKSVIRKALANENKE